MACLPNIDAETIYKISSDAASLTHGHPAARQSSGAFSWLIHALVMGGLGAARGRRLRPGPRRRRAERRRRSVWPGLEAALTLSAHDGEPLTAIPSPMRWGWVGWPKRLWLWPCTLFWPRRPRRVSPVDHFLAAIRLAANHSGDSDSTAVDRREHPWCLLRRSRPAAVVVDHGRGTRLIRHLGAEFIKLTTGE